MEEVEEFEPVSKGEKLGVAMRKLQEARALVTDCRTTDRDDLQRCLAILATEMEKVEAWAEYTRSNLSRDQW